MTFRQEQLEELSNTWYWPRLPESEPDLAAMFPDPAARGAFVWGLAADGVAITSEYFPLLGAYAKYADFKIVLALIKKYLASASYFSHASEIEKWDESQEQLFDDLVAAAPKEVAALIPQLPKSTQTLVELCLAKAGKGKLSETLLLTLARARLGEWESRASTWWESWPKFAPKDEWLQACRTVAVGKGVEIQSWGDLTAALADAPIKDVVAALGNHAGNHLRLHAMEVLRDRGAAAIPELEAAFTKAWAKAEADGKKTQIAAIGVALVALYLDAGKPVPVALDRALHEDINTYAEEDFELVRDLFAKMPVERVSAIFAEALKPDGYVRPRAIQMSPVVQTPEVLANLVAGAKPKAELGHEAKNYAVALRAFGAAATAPCLAALADKETKVGGAQVFIDVLGASNDASVAPALVASLGHSTKGVRESAVAALRSLGAAARAALEDGAKAKKAAIRDASTDLLKSLAPAAATGGATPMDAVVKRAAGLSESDKKSLLDQLKARMDDYYHQPKLIEAIAEKHGTVLLVIGQEWFVKGAEDYKVRGVWNRVVEKLAPNPEAAWVATVAFSQLQAFYPHFVREVVQAMGEYKEALLAPTLSVLDGPPPPLREYLYERLNELGAGEAAHAVYLRGMKDTSKVVRGLCVDGLAAIGASTAKDAIALLGEKKKDVRLSAAELLSRVASADVAAEVSALLGKEKVAEIVTLLEKAAAATGGAAKKATGDVESRLAAETKAKLPKYLDLSSLPVLRTKAGKALSKDALHGLVTRLMKEGPDHVDAEARAARAELDDADCAAWSLAVKDLATKDKWVLFQQAVMADETRIDHCGPKLADLTYSGQHAQAGVYLDVMARHGLRGLSWVAYWASHGTQKSLYKKSKELLEERALADGVTLAMLGGRLNPFVRDDVADAEVPTLDLDAQAGKAIGKKGLRFVVGGDFAVTVHDGDAVVKAAPKEAASALKEFRADVKRVVASESARLEQAMIAGRRWSTAAFHKLFVGHPLMTLFGQSLVFTTDGKVRFRVTAEKEMVDVSGAPVTLPATAQIWLVHPAEMAEKELAAWRRHLADFEVTQPFPQIDRPICIFSVDEELEKEDAIGRMALQRALAGLGWLNGHPEDAGVVYDASLLMPDRGVRAILRHGGVPAGGRPWDNELVNVSLSFEDLSGESLEPPAVDKIAYSEAVLAFRKLASA